MWRVGWHSGFGLGGQQHININKLLVEIKLEQNRNETVIIQLSSGQEPQIQKKKIRCSLLLTGAFDSDTRSWN